MARGTLAQRVERGDIVQPEEGIHTEDGHHIGGLMLTVVEVHHVLMCTHTTGERPFPVPADHVKLVHHLGEIR